MGSLRGWSGCNSRLFFWIYQSIAWQGVFLCSFFFLSCIGYGASWGHRIVQHTHPSPFFLFLCRQLISSSFLHFVGGVHGKRHEAYMARYQAFLYGGGGRIYSTRQLGGRGEDDISGSFKSPLCFFFFGLGFASSKFGWARDRFVAFFFFIVRSNVFFVVHHHYPRLGFSISLSLSLTSLTHVSSLSCRHVVFSYLLIPMLSMCLRCALSAMEKMTTLCPWMDDGWTRGCTEQDGLVSRLRRPMDDDDEDKVERWMDDLEQRWTSW